MDKDIKKIDKAIDKAKRTAESKKAEKNPKVKEGANKVIKELEAKKKEIIRLKEEKEKADKEAREAKTEEAKKKAELKALKADRAYKKFLKAEKPVMMVCKIITTLTSVTALVTFFVMASKISGSDNLFSRLSEYVSSGGSSSRFNRETEGALRGLGRALGDGFSYGNRYHSVVTEDTNYFPY